MSNCTWFTMDRRFISLCSGKYLSGVVSFRVQYRAHLMRPKGCSSDIMMHFYSLSSDLRNWKTTHGLQPEILAYWQELTEKYDLLPNIEFNSKVIGAEWDNDLQLYHVLVEDVKTRAKVVTDAHIVISSIGRLDIPRWPNVPGTSRFKGIMFHSAQWRHDVELTGKKVAVVGSGPTA